MRRNADGLVIEKTGSFAQTNLPQPVTGNTFNADNEMTAFNGTAMTGACPERSRGNANGNLLNDGSNTYAWDTRNHLSAITGANTASFVGAWPEQRRRHPLGRRMSKTIGSIATSFLGACPERMRRNGLNPVQELQAGAPSANLLTGLGIDEYFRRTDASGASSYLTDALGSTLALANPAGGLATSYTYDPFGSTTVSGSSTNPFQFTGRENDGTGLYYYRARYYSSTAERFIAQDPLGFGGGDANIYAYAFNSPIDYIDPTGFDAIIWGNTGAALDPITSGPTNGNYGGRNWTGGLGPDQAGPPAPPSSSADICYAAHDECFDSCTSKSPCPDNKNNCQNCNQALIICLQGLPDDPHKWPLPPDPSDDPGDYGARQYREGAIFIFKHGLW